MIELTERELALIAGLLATSGEQVAGPLTATLISGGRSNLTFRLDDTGGADGQRWVLRMPPRSGRTPSAHDVAREHRVTTALSMTAVPVPRPVLLVEDEYVLGGPFTVARFVEGRSVQSAAELDTLPDEVVQEVASRLTETLAALHGVDHVAVGLERFGRPDAYAERQLKRWSGQWDLVGACEHGALAREVISRIGGALPPQARAAIVHGDFRVDNTLLALHPGEPARVAAVVDWELSTIGDPVADVAMMCAYRHPAFDLVIGEPTAWASPRLPSATRLAELYESASGAALTHWDLHLALACFKIAVIAAGIDHRLGAGGATGAGFASAGTAVGPFLEASLDWLASVDGSRAH